MKHYLLSAALLFTAGHSAAFSQETHKRIVIDAVNYMAKNPTTTRYAKLQAYAQANGMSVSQLANVLGQAAFDVDDFEDTFFLRCYHGRLCASTAVGSCRKYRKVYKLLALSKPHTGSRYSWQ